MPEAAIKFGIQESGQTTLAGAPATAINVIVDRAGAVRRRPGIRAATDLTESVIDEAGIVGLYQPVDGKTDLLAVGNGARRCIYRVLPTGADNLSPGTSNDEVTGTSRPTFAETDALVVIAGGRDLQRVNLAKFPLTFPPYVSQRLGGSPPFATHVVANKSRLVCNDVNFPDHVNWSGPAANDSVTGHETWNGAGSSGFFAGESRPDPVRAVMEGGADLFIFGATTTEIWQPDPQDIYTFVASREYGLASPHAAVRLDGVFMFLDHRRRIVATDGSGTRVVSDPIKATLDAMDTTDAFAYRVLLGALDGVVWTFPAEGRTFVYQVGGGWSEWRGWSGGTMAPFGVTAHVYRPSNGENVVAIDGRLGALSFDAHTDLGSRIESYVTSGHQSHGTDRRKWCKAVHLVMSRPQQGSSTVLLSWRDDEGAWKEPLRYDLRPGDPTVRVTFRSLGTYYRRDWRVQFGDGEEWALAGATEEFEIMAS